MKEARIHTDDGQNVTVSRQGPDYGDHLPQPGTILLQLGHIAAPSKVTPREARLIAAVLVLAADEKDADDAEANSAKQEAP